MAGRILITSARAGAGHLRAGAALLAAARAAGVEAEHVDVLELAPRWVRSAYAGGFELVAARAPRVWRELYTRSDGYEDEARWGDVASRILFREFRHLLRSGGYDYCLCTHFLPAQLAAGRAGLPPFGTVVTDHTLHRYWVQRRVSDYFVASSAMADELTRRLPFANAIASGIPVDSVFGIRPDCDATRAACSMEPNARVVLVMGGGLGIGVEQAALAAVDAAVDGLRVIAVCGHNEAARQRLLAHPSAAAGMLMPLAYIPDIHRYMAAADVVVTKPGGLTTSEALAAGRPMILTRALPGHEEANVRYLTDLGVALTAPADAAVTKAVNSFFRDAQQRQALTERAQAAGRPSAAHTIIDAVRTRRHTEMAA